MFEFIYKLSYNIYYFDNILSPLSPPTYCKGSVCGKGQHLENLKHFIYLMKNTYKFLNFIKNYMFYYFLINIFSIIFNNIFQLKKIK